MPGKIDSLPLRRTKLYRPRATGDLLPRPRLLERLDHGRQRPMTLVCAPPGYGKTSLLQAWLERCDWPSSWLSLDEHDNDLALFLRYFFAAVQNLFPAAGEEILNLLKTTSLPALHILTRDLVNNLDQIEQSFILVLDDYHLIREPVIHEMLAGVLRHPPRSLHLALASRRDPPLPLADLRARRQVSEIRTRDLQFTRAEISAFLAQTLGTQPDDDTVAALEARTEGWIAALHLAVLSMRERDEPQALVQATQGADERYVMEYLVAQVLERQSSAHQGCLLKMSILDRFSAPLCEALCAQEGGGGAQVFAGQDLVDWLEESNLFLVSLDDRKTWYRFHYLFRRLLRSRLVERYGADEVDRLHIRASEWFARNGLIEEALRHARSGAGTAAALDLMAHHHQELLNQEDWRRLELWVHAMFPALVDAEPGLLVVEAWLMAHRFSLAEIPAILDRIEDLLVQRAQDRPTTRLLWSEMEALRSQQFYWAGDGRRAVEHARRSLDATLSDARLVRGTAVTYMAAAYQMLGDLESAHGLLNEYLSGRHVTFDPQSYLRLLLASMNVQWMAADLRNLVHTATHALAFGRERDLSASLGAVHHFLGAVHYQWNELDRAETHFATAFEQRYALNALYAAHSGFGLALTHLAQGRPAEARKVTDEVVAHLLDRRNRSLLPGARALEAELALQQGDLAAAGQWAARPEGSPLPAMATLYAPSFSVVRVLLAQDTPAARQEAASLLSALLDLLAATHNVRFQIEALALQALLLEAQGDSRAALGTLERALSMARPGGLIRLFVDQGPGMGKLLRRLAAGRARQEQLDHVLAAFARAHGGPAAGRPPSLSEPLTGRELEVLVLLAEHLSNKEIAARLVISAETVKMHASNIYRKLGVEGRGQAVARATSLGLLGR